MTPRTLLTVAAWYLTLVAAALTGWALALVVSGYHGAGLAWLGAAALVFTITGTRLDRRGRPW